MSGDIRTFRNIYATNSFCLRDETSCDEDKGVNPHNPGGGRGGGGGRECLQSYTQSYRCFLVRLFVRRAAEVNLLFHLPPVVRSEVWGVRCEVRQWGSETVRQCGAGCEKYLREDYVWCCSVVVSARDTESLSSPLTLLSLYWSELERPDRPGVITISALITPGHTTAQSVSLGWY